MPDQTLSDQITLSDDSSQIGLGLSFSEKIGLFDAGNLGTNEIARILYADFFQFQDSVGFSLNTIGIIGIGFSLNDSIALSDSQGYFSSVLIPLRDSLLLADTSATSLFKNSRALFDSLNLADSFQFLCPVVTATNDSVSLSDSIGLSQTFPSTDSVSLSDSATITIGNLVINTAFGVSDTITLFDSTQQVASNKAVAVGDFLNLQDLPIAASLFFSTTNSYLRRYLNDAL